MQIFLGMRNSQCHFVVEMKGDDDDDDDDGCGGDMRILQNRILAQISRQSGNVRLTY